MSISWRRSPLGLPEASPKGSASSLRTRPGRIRQEQRTEIQTSGLQIFVPDQASGRSNIAQIFSYLSSTCFFQGEVQIETKSRNLGRHNKEKLNKLVTRVYEYIYMIISPFEENTRLCFPFCRYNVYIISLNRQ